MRTPHAAGMRELTLRVRVAAYVLRRRAGRSVELLVFDHDADVPGAWNHHVTGAGRDNGMTFHCRLEPLPLALPLADGQDSHAQQV